VRRLLVVGSLMLLGCPRQQLPTCQASSRFGAAQKVPVGANPQDVAVGDLNGDGQSDLVTADYGDQRVAVWLGRAEGFMGPVGSIDVDAHLVAIADFNRDGHLDVVATHHDQTSVYVSLGDGTGALAPAPGSPFPSHGGTAHNHGLQVGDVNEDGTPDLVTFNQVAKTVSVLLGDGTGRFTAAPRLTGAAVAVLRGDGRGDFSAAPGSPYDAALDRPYYVTTGDFDADGRADLLVAHDDADRLNLFTGTAGGSFARASGSPFSPGLRAFAVASADFDGDGALDALAGAGDVVMILRGAAGKSLTEACRTDLSGGKAWVAHVADVDRDGRPDVIAADAQSNAVSIWK
jgi:hypothetical protein